jgi:uncharacterized protein (DUF1501 family)
MTTQSRRRFLLSGLAAGSGLATLGGLSPVLRLARASEGAAAVGEKHRYYIFCYFGGGWDALVTLDPRDPAVFTKAAIPDTLIDPSYVVFPGPYQDQVQVGDGQFVGPYLGDLANHFEDVAIVRGLNMESLSHAVGRRRFLTGKPPTGLLARGSSAATWLASKLGSENVIANLSVGVESYNIDQPAYASGLRVSSSDDLLRALQPIAPHLTAGADSARDALLSYEAACLKASPFVAQSEYARERVNTVLDADIGSLFDFTSSQEQMVALRNHYGIGGNGNSPKHRAALAGQALMSGVSRCVSVGLQGGLDTHGSEWANRQGPRQRDGFNAIATLAQWLKQHEHPGTQTSWFDHTTIVAFSEFSRTPLVNQNGGRDHHLCNSALLVGGPVNGGTIVGASSDVGMMPMSIDPKTGLPDPGGEVLNPEHILQSLMVDAGYLQDEPDYRCPPLDTLMKG